MGYVGEKGTGVFSDADFFNALLSGRARSPLGGEWIFRSGEGERSTTFTEATLVSECNRRRARGRGEGDGGNDGRGSCSRWLPRICELDGASSDIVRLGKCLMAL